MGLFGNFFEKGNKTEQPNNENLTPCKSEQELIEQFGGFAFDKQVDLSEVIGDNDWNV